MANEEHLAIIRQGVEPWNAWRVDHLGTQPDFRGAHLSDANLRSADLGDANFRHANLRDTDLCDADLSRANLSHADLDGAYLDGANLSGANLRYADLRDADLRGTDFSHTDLVNANLSDADLNGAHLNGADLRNVNLRRADFSGANLRRADLARAFCGRTVFGAVDLSETSGLEKIRHFGPSTIGTDTLYESKGKIPEVFLRGCGVPEDFIGYTLPLIRTNVIEFFSCFISYSHNDKSFARRLHDQLQARGIRCWLDEHQMLPGDDIYEAVDQGIRLWDKVLLCCSEASLSSWWVDSEIDKVFKKERQCIVAPVAKCHLSLEAVTRCPLVALGVACATAAVSWRELANNP